MGAHAIIQLCFQMSLASRSAELRLQEGVLIRARFRRDPDQGEVR